LDQGAPDRHTLSRPEEPQFNTVALRVDTSQILLNGGSGADKIGLPGIDVIRGVARNQAFSFIGISAFTKEGQVRFLQSGNSTIVQASFDGTNGAEMEIQLSGLLNLSANQFIL
jgi:hypothetical protein